MSEVKRYLAKISWAQIETQEHPNGEFVLWQDYARLKTEVERLRKAGDAVSLCLEAYWKGKPYDVSMTIKCFDAWNAAKEGKHS